MTEVTNFSFNDLDLDVIATAEGRVAFLVSPDAKLSRAARRINKLTKGAVQRIVESEKFENAKEAEVITISWPTGMAAEAVDLIKLEKRPSVDNARKAGAALAKLGGGASSELLLIVAGMNKHAEDVVMGVALRGYDFTDHKTLKPGSPSKNVSVMGGDVEVLEAASKSALAVAQGVFMTRDLVNEPANVLTTTEFAERIEGLQNLGVEVEILDEEQLAEIGMGALLSVGQGSVYPSKVAIMQWSGGEDGEAPLALVGKGVVFDTGGISIKPSGGMEDMTMDMGGAGVVTGVMKSLALRKAEANVVGLVGLVENMPSGDAYRPGDIVTSLKGDTIEVITTDAEGRLVLCDVMWYAQNRFNPICMIDLATLTGAVIIGLGHENAGVFSNNDELCNCFLKAAKAEGEGAWRMPLGAGYADAMKSKNADWKNAGGRAAGSCTAAEFLHQFVQEDMPWIHIDIAGVAELKTPSMLAPSGATGWGVMALDRMIRDMFEG
ncbi:MAG: leucyl aminopeptidase [Paracoccaceae bacterium]|nr:leucyl aminopeptidase [Paracoccaceae bacterium]